MERKFILDTTQHSNTILVSNKTNQLIEKCYKKVNKQITFAPLSLPQMGFDNILHQLKRLSPKNKTSMHLDFYISH